MMLTRLMLAALASVPRSCSLGRVGFRAMLRRHLSRLHLSLAMQMLLLLLLMLLMPLAWFAATTIPVAKATSSLMLA